MRRPGAARRAELEFSAKAHAWSAVLALAGAVLAVLMVQDPGLTALCVLTAIWLTHDARHDRKQANQIDWEN